MWLATKQGFFSVVQHRDNPEIMLVRARSKKDLECLLALAQECELEMPAIVETPTSDYACRLFVERETWESLAIALVMGIDYPNFKAAVHGDPARDQAYMQMWSAMRTFQDKQRPGWRQPQFAWTEPEWGYWPNGDLVQQAAEDELMTNCPSCGELVMDDEMDIDENGNSMCLDCRYGLYGAVPDYDESE